MTRVLHFIWLVGPLVLAISADAHLVEGVIKGIGKLLLASPRNAAKVKSGADTQHVQAKCLFERSHEFRAPPRLFFYTNKQHASNTLGCTPKKAKKITLTNRNGHNHMEAKLNVASIKRRLIDTKLFDSKLDTYFIIHGYQSSWNSSDWMCNLKDILLNRTEANVFIVDWSGGSKPHLAIDYGMAVGNTQIVGLLLGKFIEVLVKLSGQPDASSYHLIGHSLGAHVSGFAGYYVQTLGKITALDPAGPCFSSDHVGEWRRARDTGFLEHGRRRLSRQSAKLVVALHTDAALFGLPEQCAHYDVFINGGHQPFCKRPNIAGAIGGLFAHKSKQTRLFGPSCPHSFAYKLLSSFVQFFKRIGARPKGRKRKKKVYGSQLMLRSDEEAEAEEEKQQDDDTIERCHMIGYQCNGYDAFQEGECGFCGHADSSCVSLGLAFNEHANELKREPLNRLDEPGGGAQVADDNDYDDHDEHNQKGGSRGVRLGRRRLPVAGKGAMFIKTGEEGQVCLYHYQIVVAVDANKLKSVEHEERHSLALHLPLGDKSTNLVEVKHRLDPKETAFKRLKGDFIDSLRRADARVALQSRDNLAFYTKLITFKVAPSEKCAKANHRVAVGGRLCRPFERLDGARLLSSGLKKLEAVRWAALNYMSGLEARARSSRSFVLEPPAGGPKAVKRSAVNKRLGKRAEGAGSRMNFALELLPTRLDKAVWFQDADEAA